MNRLHFPGNNHSQLMQWTDFIFLVIIFPINAMNRLHFPGNNHFQRGYTSTSIYLQQHHLYRNKIDRINIQAHEKETNKDVRGSPQPWGYVHQKVLRSCNIHFISLLGYNQQLNVAFNFSKSTEVQPTHEYRLWPLYQIHEYL